MIQRYSDFKKLKVRTKDGEVGSIKDVLFDDKHWAIRYFVVDTSFWLPFKKVLLSPQMATFKSENGDSFIYSDLSKEQIENGPEPDKDLPVSRQFEEQLHLFYGWNPWWGSPLTVQGPYKNLAATDKLLWNELVKAREQTFDENLRSSDELLSYSIQSSDDVEFGAIRDFLVDTDDWTITDICMSTSRWPLVGKEFVCSPMYVTDINYLGRTLAVAVTEESLMASPDFDLHNYNENYRKTLVDIHCRTEGLALPVSSRDDPLERLAGSSSQI